MAEQSIQLDTVSTVHTPYYKCTECGREYQCPEKYRSHMRVHDQISKCFLCDTCGKGFITAARLKKHGLVHSDDKPVKCPQCDKRFKEGGALSRHIRSRHTLERPYVCQICGDKFSVAGILKVHMRTHTGERPYQCKTCGDRFTISGALKVHVRTHTGERPYNCTLCPKRFINIGHLKSHINSHIGPKQCQVCHKRFSNAESLASHHRVHAGEPGSRENIYNAPSEGGSPGEVTVNAKGENENQINGVNHSTTCPSHNSTGEKGDQTGDAQDRTSHTSAPAENLMASHNENSQGLNKTLSNLAPTSKKTFQQAQFNSQKMPNGRIPSPSSKVVSSGTKPKSPQEEVGQYPCGDWGRTFPRAPSLGFHMRIHTDDQIFPCPHCPKAFTEPGLLQQHLAVHTEGKGAVCGKQFSQVETLLSHKRIHIQQQQYIYRLGEQQQQQPQQEKPPQQLPQQQQKQHQQQLLQELQRPVPQQQQQPQQLPQQQQQLQQPVPQQQQNQQQFYQQQQQCQQQQQLQRQPLHLRQLLRHTQQPLQPQQQLKQQQPVQQPGQQQPQKSQLLERPQQAQMLSPEQQVHQQQPLQQQRQQLQVQHHQHPQQNKQLSTQHLLEQQKPAVTSPRIGVLSYRGRMTATRKTKHHDCALCNKVYLNYGNLKRHLATHLVCQPCVCSICNKDFSSSADLINHLIEHSQRMKKDNYIGSLYMPLSFKCTRCEGCYLTPEDLDDHMTRIHPSMEKLGDICNTAQLEIKPQDPGGGSSVEIGSGGHNPQLPNPHNGLFTPRILNPQNGVTTPQDILSDPQNGQSNLQNGQITSQNGLVNLENGQIKPENGLVNPQNGLISSQNGPINPQNGLINPQNRLINPQNGLIKPQNGLIKPQSGVINSQIGQINPQNGLIKPQNGPEVELSKPQNDVGAAGQANINGLVQKLHSKIQHGTTTGQTENGAVSSPIHQVSGSPVLTMNGAGSNASRSPVVQVTAGAPSSATTTTMTSAQYIIFSNMTSVPVTPSQCPLHCSNTGPEADTPGGVMVRNSDMMAEEKPEGEQPDAVVSAGASCPAPMDLSHCVKNSVSSNPTWTTADCMRTEQYGITFDSDGVTQKLIESENGVNGDQSPSLNDSWSLVRDLTRIYDNCKLDVHEGCSCSIGNINGHYNPQELATSENDIHMVDSPIDYSVLGKSTVRCCVTNLSMEGDSPLDMSKRCDLGGGDSAEDDQDTTGNQIDLVDELLFDQQPLDLTVSKHRNLLACTCQH